MITRGICLSLFVLCLFISPPSYALWVEEALCPACLKEVDKSKAIGYKYDGKTYSFCCNKCIDLFEKNPQRYGCPCPTENCKRGGFNCAFFRGKKEGKCQCYKERLVP